MSCKVYTYILRTAKSVDNFKIQAIFDNNIKTDFETHALLDNQADPGIFMYRLQYTLKRDENDTLSMQHENDWKKVEFYELYIPGIFSLTPYCEAPKQQRKVEYPDKEVWHYALFDVDFEKSLISNPPGSSLPFWNQFCLFTYYFMQHKADDACELVFSQFVALHSENDLRTDQLTAFFQTCNNYKSCIPKSPIRYVKNTEILIRMIGILPVNENNIDVLGLRSNGDVSSILSCIFKHWDSAVDSVSNDNPEFFENYVAKVLCLKLWSIAEFKENMEDTSEEAIELIRCIRDEEKQKKNGKWHVDITG
ncbi:unnamed protein product [Adineta ricciae]|uniref:Uncharacterized protein n=1 Tax=Adineta ricciae TaxID=249248 RepID=A0A816EBW9_ADIRI|nr:unnamed protein product [Adineta ricciae]